MRNLWKGVLTSFSVLAIAGASFSMPLNDNNVYAKDSDDSESLAYASYGDQSGLYLSMDEDGNISYVESDNPLTSESTDVPELVDEDTTFDVKIQIGDIEPFLDKSYDSLEEAQDAANARAKGRSIGDADVYTNDMLRSTSTPSVLYLKNTGNTLSYTDLNTGVAGYLHPAYSGECAYIRTESNGDIIFKLAGVTGRIARADTGSVQIVKWTNSLNTSAYYVKDGKLRHFVSTNLYSSSGAGSYQYMGKAPSYLSNGGEYYSYDGHYFYNDFASMSYDYQNNTTANAINSNNPFYSYYQYLSTRSKSTFTADDFNQYIKLKASGTSKMSGMGQYFISEQNTYGANATLMFGIACNESAYGTSNFAINRNNIFGLNAYDSNPNGASYYSSAVDCIEEFAQYWISGAYANPENWSYYGPHLGDKQSGMNIKYASDPYWGEKNAAQAYYLEDNTGKHDSQSYKIGVYTGSGYLDIYRDTSTSKSLYNSKDGNGKNITNMPFIILDTLNVNGTTWYKIQSDGALTSDRNGIKKSGWEYDFNNSYAYIKADNIMIVNNGSGSVTPTPTPDPDTSYTKGDVNNDGKISTMDYTLVKNHILNVSTLSNEAAKTAADVNSDGKISTMDYTLIKNHILGISYIN